MKATSLPFFATVSLFVLFLCSASLLSADSVTKEAEENSSSPALSVSVSLSDGSTLKGEISPSVAIELDTLVGQISIPLSKISSLSVSTEAVPSTSGSSLIYHCTFDSIKSILNPEVGPAGRFIDGMFAIGKKGNALLVNPNTPAVEATFPKHFLGTEGCIEFWAKIEDNVIHFGDGGDPLFFSLFDERRNITLLQFAANNGVGRGGLCGAIASWPFGTISRHAATMDYPSILGPGWTDWHHYALTWKASGFPDGSHVKVFLDGRALQVLGGVDDDKVPSRLADMGNHDYTFGIPWNSARVDSRSSHRRFRIDELKIWRIAKTEFAL